MVESSYISVLNIQIQSHSRIRALYGLCALYVQGPAIQSRNTDYDLKMRAQVPCISRRVSVCMVVLMATL